eukprot:TRINITY_DN39242_c0_g1_i1.p1 TRINITY_DN39242_c0_g1~~TRINITY_DN39242_c0_g1_i1.p1  ORF type:complete len:698 (+),score=313.53 TRINITY_DN39242_c0_g1_i1:56-2095(+)
MDAGRPSSADNALAKPEQRIAARRQKLDAARAAKRAGAEDGGGIADQEPKLGKGEEQIRESRRNLEDLKMKAAEQVTRFRVDTDVAENERRIQEEGQREQRLLKKDDEAASSAKRNASVQMKWDALFQKTIPQDLLREINAQNDACMKIILSKDRLINELKEELKNKDEEYVKALKAQALAIDNLIGTMHSRTQEMILRYNDELQAIEDAFMAERRELLEEQKEEIEHITQRRKDEQDKNVRRRQDNVEDWQQRLHGIHELFGEHYNKLKSQLQREIQGLEQQLEEMRALYQLNAEKLNYNLQVLSERVKENDKAIQTHKRKLARLQDVLSGLITKYADTDKNFRHNNQILTDSYRRITEQYKDLQLKFQYFEKADTDKFKQVWAMNEEEAMRLVNQCLKADRVVFEHQLGVEWKPPPLDFWQEEAAELRQDGQEDDVPEEEEDRELSEGALAMLEILKKQCTFLVPEQVRRNIHMLEMSGSEDEKRQAANQQLDHIFKALGVDTHADIRRMLQHFQAPGAESDALEPHLISQQDCVKALQAFMEQQNRYASLATSRQHQQANVEEKNRLRRRREEREFWIRMANVIPESHWRIWGALEKGLERYQKQLQSRAKLIDETDAIRQQNDELRALLNTYMQSKINEELFNPPQLTVAAPPPPPNAAPPASRPPAADGGDGQP